MSRLSQILPIHLEFSSKLGVRDLPRIDANHQSNVRGLYIVGDLADAPIIKVALRQGHDVAEHVASTLGAPSQDPDLLDVVIIGAGPAGIGAAIALAETGLRYVILEREAPFATIQNFPKHKLIFSEPRELGNPGNFWFEDATKETLVERWRESLEDRLLPIQQPEEVLDAKRRGDHFTLTTRVGQGGLQSQHIDDLDPTEGATHTLRARRIILAAGKRGQVNRLGIPGEASEHVQHALKDPAQHAGRTVLVVGGGDSAVEAATSLAEAGAEVTLSYRGDTFHRAKSRNQDKLQALAASGNPRLAVSTQPIEIADGHAVLKLTNPEASPPPGATTHGDRVEVPADDVFVFIGNKLPLAFLRRLGVKMQGDLDALRVAWIGSFALITYLFYVLKQKKAFFPFGEGHPLDFVPGLLQADLGFRTTDAGFWGTVLYSAAILIFGIRGYLRYPLAQQKRRYISLITFQLLFLFGIPELLAPLIIERPWKVYAVTVPWPLSIWSMVDAPGWVGTGDATHDFWTAAGWITVAALTSFVALPLYVRSQGQRFCSYLCGCGGLAETLGDFWRHLAPRGRDAKRAEWFGRAILVLAVPVTLLILNDAWGFIAKDALYSTKAFAQSWYGLMVDFWLASVVGVAFYPYLGNRVWCRFFCPLRAWMGVLAKRISKISIRSNEKCIGCGECTRYCQMGIDVQRFAQQQKRLDNSESACIQCGICIQVCPMDVLQIDQGRPVGIALDPGNSGLLAPPAATWER